MLFNGSLLLIIPSALALSSIVLRATCLPHGRQVPKEGTLSWELCTPRLLSTHIPVDSRGGTRGCVQTTRLHAASYRTIGNSMGSWRLSLGKGAMTPFVLWHVRSLTSTHSTYFSTFDQYSWKI